MKITRLEVENYKRIQLAELVVNGGSVVLGGRNGAGKSSCIDAYLSLMAGQKHTPVRPIRDGASKALIGVEFDNGMTVKKVFSAKGARLEVRDPAGALVKSPQGMLDALTGGTAFDVSEFVNLDPARQTRILQDIAGVNLDAFDTEEKTAYEERTLVNRELKRIEANVESLNVPEDAPHEQVSVAGLIERLDIARAENETNAKARSLVDALQDERDMLSERIDGVGTQISHLREEIKRLEEMQNVIHQQIDEKNERLTAAIQNANSLVDVDLNPLREAVENAEQTNMAARAWEQREDLRRQVRDKRRESEELTGKIEEVRARRQRALENANMPIGGLGIDDGVITLNGVPYSQCGEAEKYMIAAAIGLQRVPSDGARVLIMRNGGSLDAENLKRIQEVVGEADAQLLIEVPRTGPDVDIIIEDGAIATETAEKTAA